MSTETVLVSEVIFATRERLYGAWLDSKEHSAFTSEAADIDPVVGGTHTTFSGYATGQNLALEPHRRIIQSWRTTEFPPGAPDSRLEVTLEDTLGGTLITVLHTGIPSGQSDQYRDGWLKYYFAPMKAYFAKENTPDTVPDLEPGALSPAPAREVAKPNVKAIVKAKAKTPVKAKAKTPVKAKAKAPVKAKAKAPVKAKAKVKVKSKARRPPATKKKKPVAKKPAKRATKPAKKPVKRRG
jgi:uncharacterized protein YndB with AHSA1/START domain